MRRVLLLALWLLVFACPASAHYLFAWTGDEKSQGNDFLAVIDADPESVTYGKLVATVGTDQLPDALLMPYGVAVLPDQDRIVSTNSSMHDPDLLSGVTYQVWRLSDLKLLKTAYFDPGAGHYAHIAPEEPRVAADGSVYVQSLGCGIERITGLTTSQPLAKLIHTFPGNWCGVPTIVGNFLIQSVPAIHGLIALDISNPAKPVEVSRLSLSDEFRAHWTGWDAKTKRLVTTGSENRIFLVKLSSSGALSLDEQFKDDNGKPGFDMANRKWPHGWTGTGKPHGVVFSR